MQRTGKQNMSAVMDRGLRWRKVLRFAMVAVLGAVLAAGSDFSAQAAVKVIKLGTVAFPGSLLDITAEHFAKEVHKALKGKYEVKVYNSSQLGNDTQMLSGIKIGVLQMFEPSTIMSTVNPLFGVFEMPYLFKDRAQVKRVIDNPKVRHMLCDPLQAKGLHLLGFWENGFRDITNNKHPIVTPADLKGIKLRVPKGIWRVKMFQAYHANPTPMAYGDVFTALQSGVVDGQENPLSQIWSGKFYEVQKYLSLSHHVYTPAYLVAGEGWWETLPRNVQKTLTRIAEQTGDFARATGAKMDQELLRKMKKYVKVNKVDKAAFVKASQPVYAEFEKEVKGGKALLDLVQSTR